MISAGTRKSILARTGSVARDLVRRVVLPQSCVFCGSADAREGICPGCRADLPGERAERCPICADLSLAGQRCGRCLAEPPKFSRVVTAVSYRFPADAAIQRLKYAGTLRLARPLGALLAEHVARERAPDLIVPMPLSPQRLRERGFNQALELARVVSGEIGVTLAVERCVRVRDTAPQVSLPWDERRRNVRGAFQLRGELAAARVAVVDDVLTTGATLEELARVLKRASAMEVVGWVVARTERR